MNRLATTLISTLLAFVLTLPALAQNQPAPPGVIRWDVMERDSATGRRVVKPTPGPTPQVCTFGAHVGITCMDVDDIGRIYVVDGTRQRIVRLTPDGKLDKVWPNEIHNAVNSASRWEIKVLSGERVFLGPGNYGQWNIRRIGPSPEDNGITPTPPGAYMLTATEDGSFYAMGCETGHDRSRNAFQNLATLLLSYSADGKPKPNPDAKAVAELGQEGMLYTNVIRNDVDNLIQVRDLTGKVVNEINMTGVVPGRNNISSIKRDKNGDIYFLSSDVIYRLDSAGKPIARWSVYRPSTDCSYRECVMEMVVTRGLIYVRVNWSEDFFNENSPMPTTRSRGHEIQVFTSQGQCVTRYVHPPLPALWMPQSIAVAPDGSYAVKERESRTYAFDPTGTIRKEFAMQTLECLMLIASPNKGFYSTSSKLHEYDKYGTNGKLIYGKEDPLAEMNNIYQAAIDPTNGDIWALGYSGILTHLSREGKLIKRFAENRELNFKTFSVGMAVDHDGYIYVPNAYGHCIVKVDRNGAVVRRIGKEGTGLGELRYPEGIVVDSKNRIYVADSGNSRIQVFASDGKPLGIWGKYGQGNGELDRPFSLAWGPNRMLWIADTFNDRIVRVPIDQFWASLGKKATFEQLVQAPRREPAPQAIVAKATAQKVTPTNTSTKSVTTQPLNAQLVYGIVLAGTDDFSDVVYIEEPYRSWSVEAILPKGTKLNRGVTAKLWGRIETKEHEPIRLYTEKVEIVKDDFASLAPHCMDAMYIGDGYRNGDTKMDNSNLGSLVKTWARVVEIDKNKQIFIVNDGTFSSGGLVVKVDNLRDKAFKWPEVGQHIAVCGISISWKDPDGKRWSGIRIREQSDVLIITQ